MELEKGQLSIDIAPLIDVVFQLIIFFMLTSSFITQTGIKINLPKAVTSEVVQEETLVVTISAEGLIYLNDRLLSIEELKDELQRAEIQGKPLLIKADRRASLGKVVEVWDYCREAGITQVNIATDQKAGTDAYRQRY
jgi:biopolymer transport protein ExbD